MIKKQILVFGTVLAFCMCANGQSVTPDVIATAGDFYSNASGSISWTLGEPMGETYSQTNNSVTQGFQQPWDFGTSLPGGQTPVNAAAFPNPTNNNVNLQFGNSANGLYVIEVFNTLGQIVSSTQYTVSPSSVTAVSLANYNDGVYFITVRKVDGTESSSFKITKTS